MPLTAGRQIRVVRAVLYQRCLFACRMPHRRLAVQGLLAAHVLTDTFIIFSTPPHGDTHGC